MPRRRVTVKRIAGNTLRTVVEENDAWLRTFSPAQRRKVFIYTLEMALKKWRKMFLPLRLDPSIVLGPPFYYDLDKKSPLVLTGKMSRVMFRGKVRAIVPTPKKETDPIKIGGSISMPTGHPVPREIRRVLTTITPYEVQQIAKWWMEELAAISRGTIPNRSKKVGAPRIKLSPEQRKSIARGRVPRRRTTRAAA